MADARNQRSAKGEDPDQFRRLAGLLDLLGLSDAPPQDDNRQTLLLVIPPPATAGADTDQPSDGQRDTPDPRRMDSLAGFSDVDQDANDAVRGLLDRIGGRQRRGVV